MPSTPAEQQSQDFLKFLVRDIFDIPIWNLTEMYRRGDRLSSFHHHHVDWDAFLFAWTRLSPKEQVKVASQTVDDDGFTLLHYVCLAMAPTDIFRIVLRLTVGDETSPSSSKENLVAIPCGLGMFATPLHLACFAGCRKTIVEELVAADPQVLYLGDSWSRLPLHLAVLSRQVDLVQVLCEADEFKKSLTMQDNGGNTPLSLAVSGSSEVVASLLKAFVESDASSKNDFNMKNHLRDGLPLHKAVRSNRALGRLRAAGHVVRLLANAHPELLETKDHRGQTALHVAIAEGNESIESLRCLLTGDSKNTALFTKDVLGQTPLDILFQRITREPDLSLSMVKALVKADDQRKLWSTLDEKGESTLDRYVHYLMTNHSDTVVSIEILYQILLGTPPGTGYYGTSMSDSQKFLGRSLYEKFLGDKEWHYTMNMVMSQRIFTYYFMLDMYMRILLVTMFSIGTHDRLDEKTESLTWWAFGVTYVCAGYLLLWQLKLIVRYELYYIRDVWSLMDVTTLVLVIFSASLLQSSASVASHRSFHVLVGGMLWFITLTVALRSTFLPFAVFVSGLIKILQYMIPFGMTTFLILGSFAEMFYKSMIQRPECAEPVVEAEFCRFDNSFLSVYNMFLSGIDPSLLSPDTESHLLWLSVSFQIIFSIVMLNVLVAVVFDAWGTVSPEGRIVFGLHRHRFLMEVTEKGWFCFANPSSFGRTTRSLDAMDKHVEAVLDRFNARPLTAHQSGSFSTKLSESVKYFLEGAYLVVWFILGLFSAGLFWAKPFREAIFSFRKDDYNIIQSDEQEKERAVKEMCEKDMVDNSVSLRQYIDRLEREVTKLRTEINER